MDLSSNGRCITLLCSNNSFGSWYLLVPHSIIDLPSSAHGDVMPVQQNIAKPPIPRIIHEYRLQKRFQCRDDDGQWRVTEAGNGKTSVWFYGGKEQLKPPGSQSWSNKPLPHSRQDKERDAKQAFPDPTEPDHPETIIGQLKAGYGASKNKEIERWIKVRVCR